MGHFRQIGGGCRLVDVCFAPKAPRPGELVELICPTAKAEYILLEGWTTQIKLKCLEKFAYTRIGFSTRGQRQGVDHRFIVVSVPPICSVFRSKFGHHVRSEKCPISEVNALIRTSRQSEASSEGGMVNALPGHARHLPRCDRASRHRPGVQDHVHPGIVITGELAYTGSVSDTVQPDWT